MKNFQRTVNYRMPDDWEKSLSDCSKNSKIKDLASSICDQIYVCRLKHSISSGKFDSETTTTSSRIKPILQSIQNFRTTAREAGIFLGDFSTASLYTLIISPLEQIARGKHSITSIIEALRIQQANPTPLLPITQTTTRTNALLDVDVSLSPEQQALLSGIHQEWIKLYSDSRAALAQENMEGQGFKLPDWATQQIAVFDAKQAEIEKKLEKLGLSSDSIRNLRTSASMSANRLG